MALVGEGFAGFLWMAVGALIGAYQEDDGGAVRALLPMSGRTLLEYQVRCAAAAGAAPILVIVDQIPMALNDALDRLQREGLAVTAVTDAADAANRFSAGEMVLLIADGIAPPAELLASLAEEQEPAILTVPDDRQHERFERIDAASRWAGIALVEGQTIGATAAMLGDWDLQSTLLRRTLQAGARLVPVGEGAEPVMAETAADLAGLDRQLIASSRGSRSDWASRYILPLVEEFATEALLKSTIAPLRLIEAALLLTLGAVAAFAEGWRWLGLALLIATTPLDLIARRLAALRLRPLPARSRPRQLLWPAAGLALLALGWWQSAHGSGWAAIYAALACCAFAQAARVERGRLDMPGGMWLLSRRNAIFAAVPFAIAGAWTAIPVFLSLYGATSFFVAQFVNHSIKGS